MSRRVPRLEFNLAEIAHRLRLIDLAQLVAQILAVIDGAIKESPGERDYLETLRETVTFIFGVYEIDRAPKNEAERKKR